MASAVPSLVVRVGADISRLTSGLRTATSQVDSFARNNQKAFQAVGAVGTALTGIGAIAVGGLGMAVKTAANFESAMSRVAALSGASAGQLNQLTKEAEHLGATTSFSATQAAEGMQFLAMAGYKTNDIISAMPGLLATAAAGQMELGQTADIVSNILTGFGIKAEDTGRVADVLTKAFTNSNTDLAMLGQTMKYVAPVAKASGQSLELMAASAGILGNAGIQADQAGTSLRMMLIRLAKPPKMAKDALDQLGISVSDEQGNMKDLSQIIGEMAEATKDMTEADKLAAVAKISGVEASAAMLALMDAGQGTIEDFTKELENSGGIAEEIAAKQLDNLKGQLIILKSAIEGAGIAIGNALLPALKLITTWLQKAVDWFNGLSSTTQKFLIYGAALATVFGLILGPLLILVALLPSFLVGFGAIAGAVGLTSGALAILLGKITLIISAVVGIVTALVYAYNEVEWFNKAVNAVWAGLVTATKAVGKAISAAFGASLSWIVAKFGELKVLTDETLPKIADFFKQLGGSIKDLSSAGFDLIVGKLIELKNTLKDAFGGDPKALTSVFSMIAPTIIGLLIGGIPGILIASSRFLPAIADGLQKNMPAITASIDKVVNGIVSFLENSFPTFVQAGLDFITNLIQGILSAIPAVVGVLTTVLSTVIETIATLLPIILNAGITILTTLLAGIVQALPMIFDAIIMLITTLVTIITENLPVVLDSGINILMALIDGLVQALPLLLAAALGLILSIVTALVENLPKILAAGIQILLALIDGILTILPVLIETALNLILQIVMTLIENLPKIIAAGVKILVALIEGIIQILPQLIATAIKLIVQIVTTLAQNLPKILAAGAKILYELVKGILSVVWELVKAGGKLIAELVKGIVDGFGKVYDKGAEIVGEAIDGITSTIDDMVSVGEDIVSGIVKGIGNGFGWVKSKISELGGNITSWAASVLKIKSPSRVMRDKIGRWIPAGLAEGITRYSGVVVDAAKSLAEEAVPEVPAVSFGYNTPGMAGAGMMASFEGSNQRQSSSDPELLRAINRLESSLTGMRVDMDGETVGRLTRGSVNEGNAIDASLGRYFG